MPDVRANLIITARDEATTAMKGVGGAAKDTGVSMMDLYAGVRLAEMALKAIATTATDVYNATIGAASGIEQETRKLQFETGATAEQAGQLAYVADITGVGVTKLSTAINIATRALASHKSLGIEPNIEGLAKLSDMYNQIEDPIQKNAFLLHEFGRSGADMAPLMQLGADGIKALGDQATLTGNVLSQSATDQLHAYDLQVKQLQLDTKGLGVALGVELAPAAQRVVDGGLNLVHTFDLIAAAQKDGILTSAQATAYYVGVGTGLFNLKKTYDELSPKVLAYNAAQAQQLDASDRLTAAQKALLASTADLPPAIDKVQAAYDAKHNVDMEQLDFMLKNGDAIGKQIDAYFKLSDAAQTAADSRALASGLAGNLTKAEDAYGQTVEADAPKLAKLNEEMAKLVASNGQVATATLNTKYSTDQLDLANNKVQIGAERFQIAQEKLAQAHQGAKESAAAYQTRLESLQVAVQAAGDTWQSAQISLDKMNTATNASTGGVIDNTSAIAKLQGQIDPLVDAENKAKDAIDKATSSIIYQGLAADANIAKTPGLLDKLAHGLGLISDKDYNLALDTEKATETFDANIKAHMSLVDATKILTDTLNTERTSVQMDSATAIIPFTSHVGEAADKLNDAKDAALNATAAIDAIPDRIITITTNFINNTYGAGGVGYTPPTGGNIVPPSGTGGDGGGYVNPANTGGANAPGSSADSSTAIVAALTSLPHTVARAVRDAMQLR